MTDVVVVGAGVSGLACARRLRRDALEVLVIESRNRPGGVVHSERVEGFLVESGPNTILPTPGSMEILAQADLAGELIEAPRAPRFVYTGGRLRRAPWVLSPRGTLRALAEPLVRRRGSASDESLASFFERRFGAEVHERLAAPFVTGIYAGDTAELGVQGVFPRLAELEKTYGSVILGLIRSRRRGPRRRLASFREGMGRLGTGLAAGLDLRFGATARSLAFSVQGPNRWEIEVEDETLRTRALVLATPAYAASRLLAPTHRGLSAELDSVCYAPVVVAHLAAAEGEFARPLEGFGFLAGPREGLDVLGTLFSSCLFPGRAPEGQVLLTSFLGGQRSPGVLDWPDERILAAAGADVEKVLELPGGAARPIRLERYPRAIPQYRLEHADWRSRLDAGVRSLPGLFLTGNYLDGVSVPASMEHGRQTAETVIQYIRRNE